MRLNSVPSNTIHLQYDTGPFAHPRLVTECGSAAGPQTTAWIAWPWVAGNFSWLCCFWAVEASKPDYLSFQKIIFIMQPFFILFFLYSLQRSLLSVTNRWEFVPDNIRQWSRKHETIILNAGFSLNFVCSFSPSLAFQQILHFLPWLSQLNISFVHTPNPLKDIEFSNFLHDFLPSEYPFLPDFIFLKLGSGNCLIIILIIILYLK